jgi:hypothetical protein
MTRLLLFTPLLASIGCAVIPADEPCTESTGTLQGVVYNSNGNGYNTPSPGAVVTALDSEDEPLIIGINLDAEFNTIIPVGTWIINGTNASGDCFTENDIIVEIEACSTTTAEIILAICFG